MSSFNLTPEQIALLQQRGKVDPRVAAMAQQRRIGRPLQQGAPFAAQAPRLAAHMLAPAPTQQPAPSAQRSAPMVDPTVARLQALRARSGVPSRDDAIFASLASKAQRLGPGVPVTLQMPIKASYMPKEVRDKAHDGPGGGIIGWDPARLNDDEFVMAVKYVERNLANMSPEEQERAFGSFASVVQQRPELREKLKKAAGEGGGRG